MSEVVIRRANPEDAPEVARVQVETWKTAYKGLMPASYLEKLSIESKIPKWRDSFENPGDKTCLIAEVNGKVIGFCNVGPTRDENANKETGELYAIYVLRAHAGAGVGSKLMIHGLETLSRNGFKEATLWVLDTNSQTRKWYESKGWKLDGGEKTDTMRGFALREVRYHIKIPHSEL